MAIKIHRHWNASTQAIQEGGYSWLALPRQWILLLLRTLQLEEVYSGLDDTCIPRSSRKAPGGGVTDHQKREPVALLGWSSAACQVTERDRWIGWSEERKWRASGSSLSPPGCSPSPPAD